MRAAALAERGKDPCDGTTSNAAARAQEAEQHRARAATLRDDLERARTMGAVRRLFSGLNPERTSSARSSTADRGPRPARTQPGHSLARLPSTRPKIGALRHEHRPPHRRDPGLPAGAGGSGATRRPPQARLGQIRERIAAIDRELAALEQEVLAHCRILATTVYRTYLGKSASRQFDVVVIDEASMLMPPARVLRGGPRHAVGDGRGRLPPASADRDVRRAARRGVAEARCVREGGHSGAPTAARAHAAPRRRCARSTGCASRSARSSTVSSTPTIRCAPTRASPAAEVRSRSARRRSCTWTPHLSTRGRRSVSAPTRATTCSTPCWCETSSCTSPRRASCRRRARRTMRSAPSRLTRSQARLIQALLEDRLGARAAGVAATVHRFQGNEKNVMVLDLTDSLGAPLGRFLAATRIEEDGARLLNVAVSRARHHVVLIGNFEYLRAKAPADAIVRRLIEHFEEHGEALDRDAAAARGPRLGGRPPPRDATRPSICRKARPARSPRARSTRRSRSDLAARAVVHRDLLALRDRTGNEPLGGPAARGARARRCGAHRHAPARGAGRRHDGRGERARRGAANLGDRRGPARPDAREDRDPRRPHPLARIAQHPLAPRHAREHAADRERGGLRASSGAS